MGPEKRSTVGSSGESWSIRETLNWHFVEMKGTFFERGCREGYGSCKVSTKYRKLLFVKYENLGLTTCQQLR